ncbi:hypothetical protein PybrP1_004691, partial [[Pythium] brassicae (nom. inval.)]
MPSYWLGRGSLKVNDLVHASDDAAIEVNPNVEKVSNDLLHQEKTGEALVICNIKK